MPLVYVQIGRLFEEQGIWSYLIKALGQMNYNFIVDIGRSDYLQKGVQLPANFFLYPFVPLGKTADDIEFVICSGQSTAVAAAILNGKQLLSVPHSEDAKELTHKIVLKGLGVGIFDHQLINLSLMQELFQTMKDQQFMTGILKYQNLFKKYDNEEFIYENLMLKLFKNSLLAANPVF